MDVPAFGRNVRDALARRFGIDERALAALRISLGVLLLADLYVRSRDLVAFYADAGVLPRAVLREQFPVFARLSLHALSGSAWVQGSLFLVAGAAAVALLLGYRTRLATVVSVVLLASLHLRNPVVLNAGDSILRRLLFWGAFLPLGGRWSVDALRAEREGTTEKSGGRIRRSLSETYDDSDAGDGSRRDGDSPLVVGVASAALLIQVVVVYAANAAFKLRGDRWLRGEAVRYAFSLEQLTLLPGEVLADYPLVLAFVDRAWLGLLVTSVLLIALTGRRRTVFAAAFVAMHLGMALTMRLGIFAFVSIAGLLAFLPPRFWDRAERLRASRVGPALDWSDRLLRRADRLLRRIDRRPSRAVRALAGSVPRHGRSLVRWTRRAEPSVVAGLLALVLVWNAATLGVVALPDGASSVVDPEEHRWDMFAPDPRATDGWYVVPARLSSGERRDAFRGGAVSWDQPPDVSGTYPNVRWYKYLVDLRQGRYEPLRPHFADYLCRRWTATHDTEIKRLAVYYVEQPTRFDGPESTTRVKLLRYSCSAGVLES